MYCPTCELNGEYIEMKKEMSFYDVGSAGSHNTVDIPIWICPKCGHTIDYEPPEDPEEDR